MRIIQLTLSLILAIALVAPAAQAAEGATVQAVLITASNKKGPADPRLAQYEAELQRNVPESSFQFVAQGSVALSESTRSSIALGRGHRIEVERERGSPVRLKVQWRNGNDVVISTTLANLQPGVPTPLGRRSSGDGEVPIVLVVLR